MRLVILEGARGTGKSTLTNKIRQTVSEITLVNPTGFHLDGADGRNKIVSYYGAWMDMLESMVKQDVTIVFDRFYFSEMVFSKLYKSYDFSYFYNMYNDMLNKLVERGAKVDIVLLTNMNKNSVESRLSRDKVEFADVSDDVKSTLSQQTEYMSLINDLSFDSNVNISVIETDNSSAKEVYDKTINLLNLKTTK